MSISAITPTAKAPYTGSQSANTKLYQSPASAGRSLQASIKSVYHRVISLFCFLTFQHARGRRQWDQAKIYSIISSQTSSAKRLFGERIISFATNVPARPRIFGVKNEMKALEKAYGPELIEKQNRAIKEMEKYDPIASKANHTLKQYPIGEGICTGMSMDFIARFLGEKTKRQNISNLEAVKKVSRQFLDGGTKEAVMSQITYSSFSKHLNWIRYALLYFLWKREGLEAKGKAADLQALKEIEIPFDFMSNNHPDFPGLTKFAKSHLKEVDYTEQGKMWEWFIKAGHHVKNDLLNINVIAAACGLKLDFVLSAQQRSFNQESSFREFTGILDRLENGVYFVCHTHRQAGVSFSAGGCLNTSKHAMVLIKGEDGENYYFDPNYGAIDLTEQNLAKFLAKHQKTYVKKSDQDITLSFCKCELL